MDTIVDLLLEYKLHIGLGLLVLGALLALCSETLRGQLKKGIILLVVIAGLGLTYSFITGKSPADIPHAINSFFNDPKTETEPSHRYYKDPEERFKDQLQ